MRTIYIALSLLLFSTATHTVVSFAQNASGEADEKWALDQFSRLTKICAEKSPSSAKHFFKLYDELETEGFSRIRTLGKKQVTQMGEKLDRQNFFITLSRELWPQHLPDEMSGVASDRGCWESFSDVLNSVREKDRLKSKSAHKVWLACKRTQLSGNSGISLPPIVLRLNQCLTRLRKF